MTDDENPYLLGNAICVPTSLGEPFGLAKWTGVRDAPATGNWWGTNTPLFGWNIWGTVDYDPWIVFGLTEAGSPPYPADGVTPMTVTVSLNDGSGNTVYGVARTITVETSGGSFVGGGTVVTVTLDDNGEADVALIAPANAGSVVLTATDYCGTAIAFPLQLEGTDLAIAKAGGGYDVGPGEAITYTISYSNISDVEATAVWITDTLPGSASYVADTSGLTVSSSLTQVWWEVGNLLPHTGNTFVLTLTAAAEDCGTTITNTASITSAIYDEQPEDNVDASLPVAVVCADVAVTKTVALLPAWPGDVVTYTIRVSNSNPYSATGVYVTETVPAYTSFEGGGCTSPPSCVSNPWALDGGVYSVTVGELGPYGEAVVEFVVRITDTLRVSVTVDNQACAWSEHLDLNPVDNCASQQMLVRPRPMQVSKEDHVSCAFPGDIIHYAITYANPRAAENEIVLTEHLPEHTTYVGGSEWAYGGGNVYTRSLGAVAGGAGGTVEFVVRIDDPLSDTVQAITNVVEISDGEPFTLSTPLPMQPDLTVVKNDNLGMAPLAYVELYEALSGQIYAQRANAPGAEYVLPGQVISYSIVYVNAGRTTAHHVAITETLPLHTSYVGYGWTDTGDGRHFTMSVGTLDPGMGDRIEFYVRVSDSVPSGVEWIHNLVEIGGDEEECSSGDNVSSEETPLTGTVPVAGFHLYLPIVLNGGPVEPEPPRVDIEVGPHPKSLVISERLNRVYVTLWDDDGSGNPGGDGRLVVLNLATRGVISKVLTGGVHPGGIAMLGGRLYVANHDSNNVAVIDATSLAVLRTIGVGRQPFGVAAAGDRVYVTNFDDGTLSIIDASSDTVIGTVPVGVHPSIPAVWNDCAYVPNHSGGESVTVVCEDGAEVHRLREEWGHFAAAVDPAHEFAYIGRRDGVPGMYEISLHPPYDAGKPVRKKSMWGKRPFAIAYNPTTNHILVVAAANNELHIIWPGGYGTGNVWTLLPQNEGDEWHGGQGIDTSGHDVWVTNYADGSVSILFDPM